MGSLSEDMKRVVEEQRLGFYATVNEDGSPNLSPKGSTFVLDDERLFFADYRSPQTVENIRRGSLVEVNVVDPLSRKGYRFKGTATVHTPDGDDDGGTFERGVAFYESRGTVDARGRIRGIVVIEVERALPVTSPSYDIGLTEAELRETNLRRLTGS
jgi:predicted pyridoxine 5'-phosphate oxidase superfamily flavin-nucleotide-binding protein